MADVPWREVLRIGFTPLRTSIWSSHRRKLRPMKPLVRDAPHMDLCEGRHPAKYCRAFCCGYVLSFEVDRGSEMENILTGTRVFERGEGQQQSVRSRGYAGRSLDPSDMLAEEANAGRRAEARVKIDRKSVV